MLPVYRNGEKMGRRISMTLRNELIEVLGKRYREGTIQGKGNILDEFVKVSGYHRKRAIRLLSKEHQPESRKLKADVFTMKQLKQD